MISTLHTINEVNNKELHDIIIEVNALDKKINFIDFLIMTEHKLSEIFETEYNKYVENKTISKECFMNYIDKILLKINHLSIKYNGTFKFVFVDDNKEQFDISSSLAYTMF